MSYIERHTAEVEGKPLTIIYNLIKGWDLC